MGFLQQASSALTPQSTYTAQVPQIQQQNLMPALQQSQQGFNQDQSQQQALAQQMLAQSQGQGPNLAQMQLQQATQQNAAQGAGMIASQKGIDPALAARMAAQQTANVNQQAAGQSGIMRGQQQLQQQAQLGGLYGQISGQQLQNQSTLQSAQAAQNNAINTGVLGAEGINAGVAMGNMAALQKTQGQLVQGIGNGMGGAGSAMTMGGSPSAGGVPPAAMMAASGGMIPAYDDGGVIVPQPGQQYNAGAGITDANGPQSALGKNLTSGVGGFAKGFGQGFQQAGKDSTKPQFGGGIMNFSKGGAAKDFRTGGPVPGKAEVKGDSLKNDTVPAMVSPGEIVIPRSVTQGKDPSGNAAKFVAAVLAKKGKIK